MLERWENRESGEAAAEGDRTVQVVFTFETEDGRYCRAFGSRDTGAAADGVACRNGTQWQVVAWDGTAIRAKVFRGSSELLDDVMDRLGGGAVLEVAEERALIERHWSARSDEMYCCAIPEACAMLADGRRQSSAHRRS